MNHVVYYPVGSSELLGRTEPNVDIAMRLLDAVHKGVDVSKEIRYLGPGWSVSEVGDGHSVVVSSPPGERWLILDDYEWTNLRAALLAAYRYDCSTCETVVPSSPLEVLNSGDCLGQVLQKLTPVSYQPNKTAQEHAEAARRWEEPTP